MYTCGECAEFDCEGHERNPQAIACDDFTLDEIEEPLTEDQKKLAEVALDVRNLYGTLAIVSAELGDLQRKFDTVVSAIVKATSTEEDR